MLALNVKKIRFFSFGMRMRFFHSPAISVCVFITHKLFKRNRIMSQFFFFKEINWKQNRDCWNGNSMVGLLHLTHHNLFTNMHILWRVLLSGISDDRRIMPDFNANKLKSKTSSSFIDFTRKSTQHEIEIGLRIIRTSNG